MRRRVRREVPTEEGAGGGRLQGVSAARVGPVCVAVVTLGCARNLVDSEGLVAALENVGFQTTTSLESADAIVVNTCAFIGEAVEESKGVLREVLELKRKGGCRAVICVGCLTQRYRQALAQEFPDIDGFVGVNSLSEIGEAVWQALGGERPVLVAEQPVPFDAVLPRRLSTPPWSAYLRVAEGCDNACSFCTIPLIRGPQRSRPLESVFEEAEGLAASGVKEINLIAQDTTRYGLDPSTSLRACLSATLLSTALRSTSSRPEHVEGKAGKASLKPEATLASLLGQLENISGLRWIRVLYGHPSYVTPELVEVMADSNRICHYLDLPIQHVSRKALRGMNRGGDAAEFRSLFRNLRERMPDVALRTTALVGFPGEREEDFEELLKFVEEIRFDWLGAFSFSREEGTSAFDLPDQVPEAVKRRRLDRLLEAQKRISLANNEGWVGKAIEVVVEGRQDGRWIGRWKRAAPEVDGQVLFAQGTKGLRAGDFLPARVTGALEYDLEVTPVSLRARSSPRGDEHLPETTDTV